MSAVCRGGQAAWYEPRRRRGLRGRSTVNENSPVFFLCEVGRLGRPQPEVKVQDFFIRTRGQLTLFLEMNRLLAICCITCLPGDLWGNKKKCFTFKLATHEPQSEYRSLVLFGAPLVSPPVKWVIASDSHLTGLCQGSKERRLSQTGVF